MVIQFEDYEYTDSISDPPSESYLDFNVNLSFRCKDATLKTNSDFVPDYYTDLSYIVGAPAVIVNTRDYVIFDVNDGYCDPN